MGRPESGPLELRSQSGWFEGGELGFGPRSWRYSMIVTDSVIEKLFVEPEVEGDPYGVSDAETMLRHFDAEVGCHPISCSSPSRAAPTVRALAERSHEIGLAVDELPVQARQLRALSSDATTSRVFINGDLVGGAEELANRVAELWPPQPMR